MGEAKKRPLRLHSVRRLKLEFHGAHVSSDAGLLAYRELDEVLGLTEAPDRKGDSRLTYGLLPDLGTELPFPQWEGSTGWALRKEWTAPPGRP